MVYREMCLSIFYGSGVSLGPTRQETSESSQSPFLKESQNSSYSYCGAFSPKDSLEISTGSDERAVGADLQNSQETTKRRNISLKPILSKEWAEDKIRFFS